MKLILTFGMPDQRVADFITIELTPLSMARITATFYAECKLKLGDLELMGTSKLISYHGLELLVLAM